MSVARNDDNNEDDDDVTKTLKRSILGGGEHDSDATEEEDFESFLESKVNDKDDSNRSNSNSNNNDNNNNNEGDDQKDIKSENDSRNGRTNETLAAGNEIAMAKTTPSATSSLVETLAANSRATLVAVKLEPQATGEESSSVSRIETTKDDINPPYTPAIKTEENLQTSSPRTPSTTTKPTTPNSTPRKPMGRRDPDWEGRPSEIYPGGGSWPDGWVKRVYKRLTVSTSPAGRKGPREDRYWYSPDNRKFRSIAEIQRHLEDTGVISPQPQKSPGKGSKPKNSTKQTSGNKHDTKDGTASSSSSKAADALDALSALKKQFLADAMNIRTATAFLQARTTDIGIAFVEWRESRGMKPLKANGASASVSGWKTAVRNTMVGLGIELDLGMIEDSSNPQKKKRGRGRPPKLSIVFDKDGAGGAEPPNKKKKRLQPLLDGTVDPIVLEAEARIGTIDLGAILEAGPKNAFEASLVKASSSCRSVVDAASTSNLPRSAVDWLVRYEKGEAEVLKKLGRPRLSDALEWGDLQDGESLTPQKKPITTGIHGNNNNDNNDNNNDNNNNNTSWNGLSAPLVAATAAAPLPLPLPMTTMTNSLGGPPAPPPYLLDQNGPGNIAMLASKHLEL